MTSSNSLIKPNLSTWVCIQNFFSHFLIEYAQKTKPAKKVKSN